MGSSIKHLATSRQLFIDCKKNKAIKMPEQVSRLLTKPCKVLKYSMGDMELGTIVGTGSFSTVCLCLHKPTTSYYALKTMPINHIMKFNNAEHVKNEKSILQEIQHPFLLSLTWSYKDNINLYLMFPYVPGGELFIYLRMAGTFSPAMTLFYSAEIVSALSYLHSLNIIYRDLKPENILLAKDGHIVITDFGFSKKVVGKTWTLCGTPEYLAPEIIQSKGHNKAVDWWALGILIYEMLAGYPPFCDDNTFVIYEKILEGEIVWPTQVEEDAKDLVSNLLEEDSNKRLGCMKAGAEDIKRHRWFKTIDWDEVYCRQLKPPIVPKVRYEGDTENFDDYPETDWASVKKVSDRQLAMFDDF